MEVDVVTTSSDPPLRETLAATASGIRALQTEVKTLQDAKPPTESSALPQYHKQHKRGTCWYCSQPGHYQQQCKKRQRDGAPTRSAPKKKN